MAGFQNKSENFLRDGFSRFFRQTKGATSIEFALVFGVVVLLVFGILEFGRALHTQNAVEALADTAARKALIEPNCELNTADLLELQGAGAGLRSENLRITPPSVANNHEILVEYDLTLILPFIDSPISMISARKNISPLCAN